MKKAKSGTSSGRLRRILLSKQFCITVLVLMSLLAIICLVKVVLSFLPVRQFAVEGNTHYEVSELVGAAGIKNGDKLYKIDKSEVEEALLKNCPYIKEVKIKRNFPNTLCFVIEEKEPGWYIEFGNEFFSLDYDMQLLAKEVELERVTVRGMTKLVLPQLEEVIISQNPDKPNVPVFASDDEHLIRETLKIIDTFRTHEIKSRLTMLDLTNRFEIYMTIDEKYEVYFGEVTNFDTKIKELTAILARAEADGLAGGRLTWTQIEDTGHFAMKEILPPRNTAEDSELSE